MDNPFTNGSGELAQFTPFNWMNGKRLIPDRLPQKLFMDMGLGQHANYYKKEHPGAFESKPSNVELKKITGKQPKNNFSEVDWEKNINMGMSDHPFSHPTAIIPRQFRFLVETEVNTKFQNYVKNVEIDWVGKKIRLNVYETTDFDTDEVLCAYTSKKNNRPLLITLYDGCGRPIMGYRFHGVALRSYSTPLDYESSEVLTNKALLTYTSVDKLKRPAK